MPAFYFAPLAHHQGRRVASAGAERCGAPSPLQASAGRRVARSASPGMYFSWLFVLIYI